VIPATALETPQQSGGSLVRSAGAPQGFLDRSGQEDLPVARVRHREALEQGADLRLHPGDRRQQGFEARRAVW
jgi:hypothetical protein